jgi:hypothetical protein
VFADGRWFGTAVEQVAHLYCVNSATSFVSAVFNHFRLFPPIIAVLFSSALQLSQETSVMYDLHLLSLASSVARCQFIVHVLWTAAEQPVNQAVDYCLQL